MLEQGFILVINIFICCSILFSKVNRREFAIDNFNSNLSMFNCLKHRKSCWNTKRTCSCSMWTDVKKKGYTPSRTTYYLPWNSSNWGYPPSRTTVGRILQLCNVSSVSVNQLNKCCAFGQQEGRRIIPKYRPKLCLLGHIKREQALYKCLLLSTKSCAVKTISVKQISSIPSFQHCRILLHGVREG